MTHQPTFSTLLVVALVQVGCMVDPGGEALSHRADESIDNGVTFNALTKNALTKNALTKNALTKNALTKNGLSSDLLVASALATDPNARTAMKYIFGCAQKPGVTERIYVLEPLTVEAALLLDGATACAGSPDMDAYHECRAGYDALSEEEKAELDQEWGSQPTESKDGEAGSAEELAEQQPPVEQEFDVDGQAVVLLVPPEVAERVDEFRALPMLLEGQVGVAPEWGTSRELAEDELACGETCQQRVSACVISRLNAFGQPVSISLRAPFSPLDLIPASEYEQYGLAEGAFWGNLFGEKLSMHACSNGVLPGEFLRICSAHEDGAAQCGITFEGECNRIFTIDPIEVATPVADEELDPDNSSEWGEEELPEHKSPPEARSGYEVLGSSEQVEARLAQGAGQAIWVFLDAGNPGTATEKQ